MDEKKIIEQLQERAHVQKQVNENNLVSVRMQDITDRLWRPKEIETRLRGISTRQITDLAERKIITPALDTTGAGSARLYDACGLYSILLSLAVRGILTPSEVSTFVTVALSMENEPLLPAFCAINIHENLGMRYLSFNPYSPEQSADLWHFLNAISVGECPKDYLTSIINLRGIKRRLQIAFK